MYFVVIYGFFGINFILQKFCPCKKNDKYQVCQEQATSPFNCADDWVPGKHYSLLLEMEEGVSFGPTNATPYEVMIKVRTSTEKRSFFGSLKRNLLLRDGIETNPGPVMIGKTLDLDKKYTFLINKFFYLDEMFSSQYLIEC